MSTPTWGLDPKARRISVYYEGDSTIYEGMPVCYNYDTTDNWMGVDGSKIDFTTTASTASLESTTTAESSQNEGKFIRVENPADNNLTNFAGVVAGADHAGETGPKALDIYVPNGAIVPCRCDVDTTVGVTILAITVGSQELGQPISGTSRPVGIAAETESDLDTTADITLVKLDPNMFVYQNLDGTALSVGAGTSTLAVNEINITSAQTTGNLNALKITVASTAGTGTLKGLQVDSSLTAGTTSINNIGVYTGSMGSATVASLVAYQTYMGDHGASCTVAEKHAFDLNIDNTSDATLCSFVRMYNHSGGVGTIDAALYFANGGAESVTHLLKFAAEGDCLQADTNALPNNATHKIKCIVGTTAFYLIGVADF